MSITTKLRKAFSGDTPKKRLKQYYKNFITYSYIDSRCKSPEQFQASITRLYHTIEKGLTYREYRPGFGKENIEKLLTALEQYHQSGYDISVFFYETAISCLKAYIEKNRMFGLEEPELERRVHILPGKTNGCGGTIEVTAPLHPENMTFEQTILSRHSIRHFSDKPVEIERIGEAIRIAQHTPSACNRQGWKTRIIINKEKQRIILANQNGNRGFGHEFDKILVITADLRAQQQSRELFQAYIDGGMYAGNILNSLYFQGIGSVPLSAALNTEQERKIRTVLNIDDAEVFILFIGIGNYPAETVLTTKSERRPAEYSTI